ncbi:DUF6065 family protein [Paraburkholderia aspalathi]|uniref:DUF6065 family protein n=1 Tax=Paraburkholderia aspalathi TaxID=1324617 RepID=UPI0038BC2230
MTTSESRINDENYLVPPNTIAVVTEDDMYNDTMLEIVDSLKGKLKRDWLPDHAYHCLPILIGNQYGFGIRSLFDVAIEWNGGGSPSDLYISVDDNECSGHQFISSHFGAGIVTLQNRFHFRTPRGVNLMAINPPNMFTPGILSMTAVIESDNLRRDFTFNLKVTLPNQKITIKKGDIISAVIPIPRYFVDQFSLVNANDLFSRHVVENERAMGAAFARERQFEDPQKPHGNGKRYWDGEDAMGTKFADHQRRIT